MSFWAWCIAHKEGLIIAAVVAAVLILIICIAVGVHKRKKQSDVKNIYKTKDGYFNSNDNVTKTRRVAVIDQRKDDGAVAVVKIYSQKDRKGNAYIANLILTPKEHKVLTENSIVGSQVIIGVKKKDGSIKPILTRELSETDDKLTDSELKAIKKGVHNDTPEHRKTYKKKMRRWRQHFKK